MPRLDQVTSAAKRYDVAIVGAGFAGLYALHRLRNLGFSARLFEAGSGVGGTWFWNRYPGARCDVESIDYQYGFSSELVEEWRWSERYPRQDELLNYLNFVADRLELRDDIQLDTRVISSVFDESQNRWTVETDGGERINAGFVVMATGCLSVVKNSTFEGLDTFSGDVYHTADWPDSGVDFTGKRVAVVGTGSSGIQVIPIVAEQAAELVVFQRTANYSVPAFNNDLAPSAQHTEFAAFTDRRRSARESFLGLVAPSNDESALAVSAAHRGDVYEQRWKMGGLPMYGAFSDILLDKAANQTAAEFFEAKIHAKVDDAATAALLTPKGYPFGSKRICVDTNYFETFNRKNVKLVDVQATPIKEITPKGIDLTDDTHHDVDIIVLATGFDAMTGALTNIDIRGRDGQELKQAWADGPQTYLGLAISGFPNMFTVTGPGSPSVFSNMVLSIEQHVEWISDAIEYARDHDIETIEASEPAQKTWSDHVNEVAASTLMTEAASWYVGANIPGKTRVFMPYLGGVGAYRLKCDEVASNDYEGFVLNMPVTASTQN